MDRLRTRYKLNISKNEMKRIGFRYDYELDDYVYRFPVYKYGRIPVLFCKIGLYEDTNGIWFNVYDNNGLYMAYYNREYGDNSILPEIEEAMMAEFKKLGIRKVA